MTGAAPQPLKGVTVVALEQAVAAPFCSSRLADAGATVIKVERPEGDFARGYDDVVCGKQSSYFVWLNRGKRSTVLDLASKQDKDALEQLIAKADILIQNLKPGSLEKLGFAINRLRQDYPRLITCSISGYGSKGPLSSRKAYDLLIQAESGLASITGGPNEPARVGISVVDIATGATAHAAVLEALLGRAQTGLGCDIEVSMFDVMADWLTVPLLHHEGGKSPRRIGLAHPSIAPYGVFSSADGGQVLIAIQSDREWAVFCHRILKDATLVDNPLYATNVMRVRNRTETDNLVQTAFSRLGREELIRLLADADIAFAEVNDMEALSKHENLHRATVDTPHGAVAIPRPGATVLGTDFSLGSVPLLGELNLEELKTGAHSSAGNSVVSKMSTRQ